VHGTFPSALHLPPCNPATLQPSKIVITGSFNFSKNASENNDENLVIVWSPEIAAAYNGEFERRWAEGKESDVICE